MGLGAFFNRLVGGKSGPEPTIVKVIDDAASAKAVPTREDSEMSDFAARANAMDDARQP
ncbi:MAG: hypothetical protein IAI48_00345 [Candidatus Eremiobacteraeota bacterium]|nr:hypothetical protein [Candidatus Eremiobacteraeota bacterium]